MKKAYFASDFHLGIQAKTSSPEREKLICSWLRSIADDASHIFLLGDLFDFWFEYNHAVPKGFTRLLGTLGELTDQNIIVQTFTGNHDLWMKNYFKDELNIDVHHQPILLEIMGSSFYLGHGDGLGPGDTGYKRMKKIFTHPVSKFIYKWLHPDIGIPLANYFSSRSRSAQSDLKDYLGQEHEWLIQYVEKKSKTIDADFFIFGHRHIPIDYTLKNNKSRYINLGDWLYHQSFAEFDGRNVNLKFYKSEFNKIYH